MSGPPTVISFACGEPYYHESATQLRADCDRLGLPHSIEELALPPNLDWSQITRAKVGFYAQKLRELGGPVLWVDVDCRLLQVPRMLDGCGLDLVGFAQRFRYLRDYDPYDSSRFWVPGILYLNHTPATLAFVALMEQIERDTTERVTDDYCLHEAWLRHERELNVGLFAPRIVARSADEVTDDTVFVYGASGSVPAFKGTVLQHQARDLLTNPAVAERVKALHDTPEVRTSALRAIARELADADDRETAGRVLQGAHRLVPDEPATVRQRAELLRASGAREEAFVLLEGYLEHRPDDTETRRTLYRFLQLYGHFDRAAAQLDILAAHADPRWPAYARSARYDLDLERRAAARGLSWSERPQMWWMKTPYPGNFGDALSPYIVEHVSGRPPRFVHHAKGLLAVGSVIKFATAASVVWGSGTPRMTDTLAADAEYRAVRGPLTRELVQRSGGTCPAVYGDPGLLLPRYYRPRTDLPRHEVGLIRHVAHRDAPPLDGVRDISIIRVGAYDIEAFVDEVTACDAILTSSLHGLITAHAYGVPARWCSFSRSPAIPGDGTKFADYFASVGLPPQTPLDLSAYDRLDAALRAEIDPRVDLQFDADALIAAFPG